MNETGYFLKHLMTYKKAVGEFSLDLYYDNVQDKCVAKISFFCEDANDIHFRNEDMNDCLLDAYAFLQKL